MQIQPENRANLIPPPIKKRQEKKSNVLGVTLALFLAFGAFFSGFQVNGLLAEDKQSASIFSLFASSTRIIS